MASPVLCTVWRIRRCCAGRLISRYVVQRHASLLCCALYVVQRHVPRPFRVASERVHKSHAQFIVRLNANTAYSRRSKPPVPSSPFVLHLSAYTKFTLDHSCCTLNHCPQSKIEATGAVVSAESVKDQAWATLNSGNVIPGFGRLPCHNSFLLAILR
jgi:hypothetical protein